MTRYTPWEGWCFCEALKMSQASSSVQSQISVCINIFKVNYNWFCISRSPLVSLYVKDISVSSLHSQLFSYVVKKSGREPGQIHHVKCVISAESVHGFVECGDLAALHVHRRVVDLSIKKTGWFLDMKYQSCLLINP